MQGRVARNERVCEQTGRIDDFETDPAVVIPVRLVGGSVIQFSFRRFSLGFFTPDCGGWRDN